MSKFSRLPGSNGLGGKVGARSGGLGRFFSSSRPPVLQASCCLRRAPGRGAKGLPQEGGRYAAREMAESAVPILPSRNLERTLDFFPGISP